MKLQTLPAPFKLATLAAGSALLAACASAPSAPPAYNPSQSAAQQADAFITSRDAKHAKDIKKVAITACNVMFAETSGASASTSPGLFGNVDNNRAEAKVTVLYTLAGLTDADMQKIADRVCSNAEAKLAAQGYQVTSHADMKGNATFLELQKAGRESPFIFNSGQTKYKVFTRSGDSIFDERYIGTLSGLGQAFKAAKGTSAWQREAQVMDQMGVSGLNLNILIDFAELQSDGSKSLGGLANKDNANVSHKVEMSVSGELKIKPNSSIKCWERFGNRECAVNKLAVYSAFRPVNIEDTFYQSINNTTTTTDKVVSGFTKAFSMLAGGTSTDITRYQVQVQPEQFETAGHKAINGFVEMTVAKLAEGK